MPDIEADDYEVPIGVGSDTPPSVEPEPELEPTPTPEPAPEENRVPYSRFAEVNSRFQAANGTIEELRRQVQALTGAKAPEPVVEEDPQETAIRTSLERMYPALKTLRDLPVDKLMSAITNTEELQAARAQETKERFATLATTTFKSLHDAAQKDVYGGQPLTDKQRLSLNRNFHAWVSADESVLARYASGDAKVVSEFMADMTENLLAPVRRSAAVTVGARASRAATLPTGGSVNGPVGTPPKPAVQTEDDVIDASWASFVERRDKR